MIFSYIRRSSRCIYRSDVISPIFAFRPCPVYFPDSFTADKAADIMGYAKSTVLAYIQQKRIFAVQIRGKYIVPKSALVEFLVGDFAFEIIHKSTWHMNTILLFVEKE